MAPKPQITAFARAPTNTTLKGRCLRKIYLILLRGVNLSRPGSGEISKITSSLPLPYKSTDDCFPVKPFFEAPRYGDTEEHGVSLGHRASLIQDSPESFPCIRFSLAL